MKDNKKFFLIVGICIVVLLGYLIFILLNKSGEGGDFGGSLTGKKVVYSYNTSVAPIDKTYCLTINGSCDTFTYYKTEEECEKDIIAEEYGSEYGCGSAPAVDSIIGTETNYKKLNKKVFNKYVLKDGIIVEGYSCIIYDKSKEPACVRGGSIPTGKFNDFNHPIYEEISPYYSDNKNLINSISNDFIRSFGGTCSTEFCHVDDYSISIQCTPEGAIETNYEDDICTISSHGFGYCE